MIDDFEDRLKKMILDTTLKEVVVESFPYRGPAGLMRAIRDYSRAEEGLKGLYSDDARWYDLRARLDESKIMLVIKHLSASLVVDIAGLVTVNRQERIEELKLVPKELRIMPSGGYEFVGLQERGSSSGYRHWEWTETYTVKSDGRSTTPTVHVEISESRDY